MKTLGKEHEEALDFSRGLFLCLIDIGNYERAMVHGEESLEIHSRVMGTACEERRALISGMAQCHRKLGNITQAENYEKMLTDDENALTGATESRDTQDALQ